MSSLTAARDTYVLNHRFDMPDGNGTRDAFAVSSSHGLILVSFYAIMMKAIVTQFWAGIVLFGVGLFLRRHSPHDSDSSAATTTIGLWNMKHSPERVAYFTAQRAFAVKSFRDFWYPLIWFAVAGVALAASLVVPIVKTQDLKIGTVAPVNPESIFVPEFNGGIPQNLLAQAYSLTVPAALRAVGEAGTTVPANTVFTSNVSTPSDNGTIVQFSYKYGLSGSDFGLQKAPDLWLNVSGSCTTDYSWYQGVDNSTGVDNDVYYLWNNASDPVYVGETSGTPYTSFSANSDAWNGFNYTYSLVPLTYGCQSFSTSTDPWYETTTIIEVTSGFPYMVANARPILSCWEEDVWSFRGNTSRIFELQSITDGYLSTPIYLMLGEYLAEPMIGIITARLGRSNLESSTTAFEAGFNANLSSLVADMNRLVNTTYIATRNILSDSTTISKLGRGGLQNAITDSNGTILSGANEFVISSAEIYTLSVRVLIIVPTVLVGIYVLIIVLAFLPEPWRSAKKLNATRLHKLRRQSGKSVKKTSKHEKAENGDKSEHIEVDVEIKGDGGDGDGDGDTGSKDMDDKITTMGM